MIELEDVGKTIELRFCNYTNYSALEKIQMVIKASRGSLALFENKPVYGTRTQEYSFPKQTKQCRAIKAFMKEHIND